MTHKESPPITFEFSRDAFREKEPCPFDGTKDSLVSVIAIGRRLCSWSGPSRRLWASFDTDPGQVPMGLLIDHVLDVKETEFPGSYDCTFLVREASEGDT